MSTIKANTLLAANGSSTTPPSIPALDTRFAAAWIKFKMSETEAILSSQNISSLTDIAVGNIRTNFTTAMANANYASVLGGVPTTGFSLSCYSYQNTTAYVNCFHREGSTAVDSVEFNVIVFGVKS
tara:strand:- start:23 stop:400 length:378 start_codon:yes stop_codon:yes gene_type:complete